MERARLPTVDRPPRLAMNAGEWLLLLALSVLWGGSYLFAKIAVEELPPLTLVLARVSIAAVILVAVMRLRGLDFPTGPTAWPRFAVLGLLNNVLPFALLFWGTSRIDSGLAALLAATAPVFAVIFGRWLAPDERVGLRRLAGVTLGVAGVAVMVGPGSFRAFDADVAAELACVGAAAMYALAGIFARRLRATPPLAVAAGQLVSSALIALPVAVAVDGVSAITHAGAGTWAAVLGLALLSTALAYVVYFRLLASAGVNNVLLVSLLVPVSALVFGAVLLGERIDASEMAGMALIALALASIDHRPLGWIRAIARGRGP
jgi:drug/metabolite transporter (DMT)-like permease